MELKTLRMASNVPLTKVREAVIGAIVDRIKLVPDNVTQQRKEITSVVERWGDLVSQIGGADAVETITLLQVGTGYDTALRLSDFEWHSFTAHLLPRAWLSSVRSWRHFTKRMS